MIPEALALSAVLFTIGTMDPLLDDSKLFAKALQDAGVPAKLSIYEDQVHVFMQLTAMLDGGKKAVAEACQALKDALHAEAMAR